MEILPQIARAAGIEDEIRELTRLTMDGVVPFDWSLRHRVELLGAVPIEDVRGIVSNVTLDRDIVDFLRTHRDRCTIVTGNLDVWVQDLVAHLDVPCCSSIAQTDGYRVTGLSSILDKATVVDQYEGVVCAIGDGYNDLGMVAAANVGIAYGSVHPPAPGLYDVASHAIFDGYRLCQFLSAL